MSNTYIIVVDTHSHHLRYQANEAKLRKYGNVNNYIEQQKDIPLSACNYIKVRCFNPNTNKYYWNVTYDSQLERYQQSGRRVNIQYHWQDHIESFNCYIGRSTGWIPIYLEIKKCDSTGGCALLTNRIIHIHPLNKYKH